MKTIDYGSILDSRDLEKRREELAGFRDTLADARKEREFVGSNPASTADEIESANELVERAEMDFGEDEASELEDLENAASEVCEWNDGATLIPVGEWEDYVQQLLEDCGDIPRKLPWYIVINWERTAKNIAADYGEIEIQGTTYMYRNC